MKYLLSLIAATALAQGPKTVPIKPVEWEHGYKTKNVIATRYMNPRFGQNIGFKFPNHPYSYDRAAIVNFLATQKCDIMDNSRGESFTLCDDVKDKESANRKLLVLMPKLEMLIRRLR